MKQKISMIIFILILGTVLTAALVGVDNYTAPIIKKNKIKKIRKSVLKALNISYSENNIDRIFLDNILIEKKQDKKFYISKTMDIAFEISGTGLWGPIQGIVAILPDLVTIKRIIIIHQEETPGLGGRIADREFLDKFNNKKFSPQINILPPGKAKEENEVDGITGATLSCNAFEEILNSQVKKHISLYKGVVMSSDDDTLKQ